MILNNIFVCSFLEFKKFIFFREFWFGFNIFLFGYFGYNYELRIIMINLFFYSVFFDFWK